MINRVAETQTKSGLCNMSDKLFKWILSIIAIVGVVSIVTLLIVTIVLYRQTSMITFIEKELW